MGLSHILAAALSAYCCQFKELVWLNWLRRGNELYGQIFAIGPTYNCTLFLKDLESNFGTFVTILVSLEMTLMLVLSLHTLTLYCPALYKRDYINPDSLQML